MNNNLYASQAFSDKWWLQNSNGHKWIEDVEDGGIAWITPCAEPPVIHYGPKCENCGMIFCAHCLYYTQGYTVTPCTGVESVEKLQEPNHCHELMTILSQGS